MATDDTIVLGVVRQDGDYDTFVEGQAYHPDNVDEIVTPISLPWRDNVVLRSLPLADFGQEAHERNMGPEVLYGTRFEGENPSSGDLWFVEVRLFEYPQGDLQITDVDSGGAARFAHFDPEDLESYMYAVM